VRTTHNDTKLNNLLFDEGSGEAICVIDLDTVMPGLALNDFGDMVRTMTCDAAEDERDLARVTVRLDLFEAVARGYLAEAGSFLTNAERELLSTAGKLITFEQGMRFLADYLEGDRYYKVHRERQNLDRARVQFKLLESMEAQENAMQRLVKQIA
jgi:thiamine kinase-like enzyme